MTLSLRHAPLTPVAEIVAQFVTQQPIHGRIPAILRNVLGKPYPMG